MSFGNQSQGGGGKDSFVRLTGLFNTAKGNLIGRVKPESFNAIFALMTDANNRGGTLNFVIANSKKTGKPELYCIVGDPYTPGQGQQGQQAGPFGQAPAQTAGFVAQPAQQNSTREVRFGSVEVPKDDIDGLLENL